MLKLYKISKARSQDRQLYRSETQLHKQPISLLIKYEEPVKSLQSPRLSPKRNKRKKYHVSKKLHPRQSRDRNKWKSKLPRQIKPLSSPLLLYQDSNQPSFRTDSYVDYSSTTVESGSGGVEAAKYSTTGMLLAVASVVFIIVFIAFIYRRIVHRRRRRRRLQGIQNAVEMEAKEEVDPYDEWLNMDESEPSSPDLRMQVKTAVRTVSRKISQTQKPVNDFIPGVPDHLRYQLKHIYVY